MSLCQRFVVLAGLAADEISELHFARLTVFVWPVSNRFSLPRLSRLWS